MQRITYDDISYVLDQLNEASGNALQPYTKNEDGKIVASVGNYHMGQAYGGHQLQQMVNEGGGIRTLSGYGTKRHLYDRIRAMLDGISIAKGAE